VALGTNAKEFFLQEGLGGNDTSMLVLALEITRSDSRAARVTTI